MGCNYYIQYTNNGGWYKQMHIGKSSTGWKFLFRGYKTSFKPEIRSVQDLKQFIDNNNAELFDEYEGRVLLSDFWDMVESKQGGMNNVKKAKADVYYSDDYWIDSEGYDFCSHEFF